MIKKVIYIAGIFAIILFTSKLFISSSENEKVKTINEFNDDYRIYAIDLPDKIDFAGEQVPMDIEDVRERLDREILVNTYWQSQTLLFFKRANKWFPLIEKILEENDLPDDLKYITLIESGLMHVTSPSGAASYWQFMGRTAREYGLEVNKYIDERYNVEKATIAACKYFKEAYKKFDNWTLVAASYNMGVAGVQWQISHQGVSNFYDMYLNTETSRYIFRLLAVKEILEHPIKYGFHFKQYQLYKPLKTKTIIIDTTINDLYSFAKQNNITYRKLKVLNPWLKKSKLPNSSRKTYKIKLPLAE
ncbi:MAG: lytic transglycosylase domain-containing protein [Bacteroidota bacterium]|nr:lytic transglycosylase domain-containing protein [Bacteroidota bacterium]